MQTALPAPERIGVMAAIGRFERESGMGSAEFARRFRTGEFGRVAWARVWFMLSLR